MKILRNRGTIRPKVTTMPRSKSEASSQLELYKLVTEQQRIKQELHFIEQRTAILKQRLNSLKDQIADTEQNINKLRQSDSRHPNLPKRPNIFFEAKNYQAFEIEY
ncbi:gas vesicle protein [Nostoc linckia FACHB-104]|nr:gas vesicle protein [Nostoc linckia FACHB-104]